MQVGGHKLRFWANIWLSDRWLLLERSTIDCRSGSYGARLFMAETATHQWIRWTEENRTEFNLRSGKSEAELQLIIEDCARRIVLLMLTTDRHGASRGLSATTGLHVYITLHHLLNSYFIYIIYFIFVDDGVDPQSAIWKKYWWLKKIQLYSD